MIDTSNPNDRCPFCDEVAALRELAHLGQRLSERIIDGQGKCPTVFAVNYLNLLRRHPMLQAPKRSDTHLPLRMNVND